MKGRPRFRTTALIPRNACLTAVVSQEDDGCMSSLAGGLLPSGMDTAIILARFGGHFSLQHAVSERPAARALQ